MTDNASGAASMPDNTGFPEPDYDHLDRMSFSSETASLAKKASGEEDEDDLCKKGESVTSQYIIGTLVVRVVAARDLEPAQKGGLGRFFGGGNIVSRSPISLGAGSANPYASVKFGNTTQRTTEVFDTLNPIWPRQETMFLDVSLPTTELTHPSVEEPSPQAASVESVSRDYKKPNTVLTVALFHTPEIGKGHKYPTKGGGNVSGDSDDQFLGMTSVDLTQVLTGRQGTFDEWLPLSGTGNMRGRVRIVCEYETSDTPPRPGDYCRFTTFCHPADLFPVAPGKQYKVSNVDGEDVIISFKSPEGWICSFQAHRFMLVCEERHHGAIEFCQEELASLTERLSYSPAVHAVSATVERLAVDGLLNVGQEVVNGGLSLLGRWFNSGLGTAIQDVTQATNWDGRYNPDARSSLSSPTASSHEPSNVFAVESYETDEKLGEAQPLPNMPECPITGQPMLDPVVAADGHTYERYAIARWLKTSDKSPLTGGVLPHKELVPNYGLLSSLQDTASRLKDSDASVALVESSEPEESMKPPAREDI